MTIQTRRLTLAGAILGAGIILTLDIQPVSAAGLSAALVSMGLLAASAFTDRPPLVAGAILLSAVILAIAPIESEGIKILPVLAGAALAAQALASRRTRN